MEDHAEAVDREAEALAVVHEVAVSEEGTEALCTTALITIITARYSSDQCSTDPTIAEALEVEVASEEHLPS